MDFSRTTRTTYIAAFLLGALIALLLVAPTRAAEVNSQDQSTGVPLLRLEPPGPVAAHVTL
jgi:hypothetical protein